MNMLRKWLITLNWAQLTPREFVQKELDAAILSELAHEGDAEYHASMARLKAKAVTRLKKRLEDLSPNPVKVAEATTSPTPQYGVPGSIPETDAYVIPRRVNIPHLVPRGKRS